MKRHIGLVASLAIALLPLAAVAAEPAAPKAETRSKVKVEKADKIEKAQRQCSMPSSSRLQKKGDECEDVTDRTRWHSQDELNSTGRTNTAEALRQINPTVQ